MRTFLCVPAFLGLGALLVACSDDPTGPGGNNSGGDGPSSGAGAPLGGGGEGAANTTGGSAAGGDAPGGEGPGGGPSADGDPNLDGPYEVAAFTGSTVVAATGNTVPMSGWAPTSGPSAGPYPTVVIAHGFQLPASQYDSYAKRLATFGYVAITPEYPTSLFGLSHVDVAEDLIGTLDWAASASELGGNADVENAGMTGHSLGGKTSLLAATMDARVKAVLALDPVDSAMNCSAQNCPDMSSLMPSLAIPTGFLGETLDGTGSFQACAPTADNYATFYAGATSPSFSVTVLGANHMSFLDDVASCGFTCNFCQTATADNATVNAMARAYAVAFFEKNLRNNSAYETYLTGAEADARYVATGQATIESK